MLKQTNPKTIYNWLDAKSSGRVCFFILQQSPLCKPLLSGEENSIGGVWL
jgi:hypothetical protein